jgi:putative copper export protein
MLARAMWQEWLGLVALTWLVGSVAVPVITMTGRNVAPLREATRPQRRMHIVLATVLLVVSSVVALIYPTRHFADDRLWPIALLRIMVALMIMLSLSRGSHYLPVVFVAGVALLLTNSLVSRHVLSRDWLAPVLTDWAHLSLSSLWVGGVFLLAFVCVPTAVRHVELRAPLSSMLARFSPLAMFCAIGLGLSGVIQGSRYISALSDLTTTPYGQALALKTALFVVLIGFGAYHQFSLMPRMRPRLLPGESPASVVTFSLTIALELSVAVGLLLCVAVLRALV